MPQVDSSGSVIGECPKLAAEYVWAEITLNTLKASEIEDELRYRTCGPLAAHKLVIVGRGARPLNSAAESGG
jgi:hypothetical protein